MARAQSADEAIIGRGTRIRGNVQGGGNLRVEGQVEGDVAVTGMVSVEAGAGVVGDVAGSDIAIGGSLVGDVSATGSVSVQAGAEVRGNLGGAEVSLEEGASFSGRIEADFTLPPELEDR